jgi:hypothetical protein
MGPCVQPAAAQNLGTNRKGFGHTGIKVALEQALDGQVQLDYPETGFEWTLNAPSETVVAPRNKLHRARKNWIGRRPV